MDYIFGMAKIQRICDCQDDLCNLGFITASMYIPGRVQLSSFTVFHDDVEVSGVVIDLIDLDDVGVFEMNKGGGTLRRI